MITQCCVCKQVCQPDNSWRIQDTAGRTDISHGYCPPCAQKAREEIEAYFLVVDISLTPDETKPKED